jgi:hypothetical protein
VFEPAGALAALLARARTGEAPLAALALEALDGWPDAEPVLQIALETSHEGYAPIQLAAVELLGRLPAPAASERLAEIAGDALLDPELRRAALCALRGDDAPDALGCGLGSTDVPLLVASPPGTASSVACRTSPRGEDDPARRIARGAEVVVDDHWLDRTELWVRVMDRDGCWISVDECWIRRSALRNASRETR